MSTYFLQFLNIFLTCWETEQMICVKLCFIVGQGLCSCRTMVLCGKSRALALRRSNVHCKTRKNRQTRGPPLRRNPTHVGAAIGRPPSHCRPSSHVVEAGFHARPQCNTVNAKCSIKQKRAINNRPYKHTRRSAPTNLSFRAPHLCGWTRNLPHNLPLTSSSPETSPASLFYILAKHTRPLTLQALPPSPRLNPSLCP